MLNILRKIAIVFRSIPKFQKTSKLVLNKYTYCRYSYLTETRDMIGISTIYTSMVYSTQNRRFYIQVLIVFFVKITV
jgi:hypothetical protein